MLFGTLVPPYHTSILLVGLHRLVSGSSTTALALLPIHERRVTTRQVVLLDLSSFRSSAKREFTVLVRSGLRYEALSTYTSQRRLVRSRYSPTEDRRDKTSDAILDVQEVELKVLPLRN